MKLYRLHKKHDNGVSVGFEYFTNLRDAKRAFHEWMKGEEEWVCAAEGSEVELIRVTPTKAGILRALTVYASHPDNG